MGSSDSPKRRREDSPELRDAWLAFETDYPDRALELAERHLSSNDSALATDAKKLVALVRFNRGEYDNALALFRDVVAVHDDAGNWFNVCTAATLGGDIQLGEQAFHRVLAALKRGDIPEGLSIPFVLQYYASALRDRGEYAKALEQIEELRLIYEQLRITDDTFLYIRGVPSLSHTMDVAVDVFRGLGSSIDWRRWIDAFAGRLDEEGRECLLSIKQRMADGGDQGDERKPE